MTVLKLFSSKSITELAISNAMVFSLAYSTLTLDKKSL